jgi:uncharacterized SAM-binding protein YcdF (DUF218 family)
MICAIGRGIVVMAAALFLLELLFAITGPPRRLSDWLTGAKLVPGTTPRCIIVLGGGGIPSASSLLRTYHAARFGKGLADTTFIVSLPADAAPDASSVGRMRDELVMRGIPASQIRMEWRGVNTHEQAVNVFAMIGAGDPDVPVLVVTSDYHMRRAMLCLRKAGFTHVEGLYAYSIGAEADMGSWTWLRYTLWSNWDHEILMSRELLALLTYKLKGWV